MKKAIMLPVFLAAFFAGLAGMLAPTPAAALTCDLIEQVDAHDHRLCRYTCVKGNGEAMKRVYEKRWMKCTACRKTFSSARRG